MSDGGCCCCGGAVQDAVPVARELQRRFGLKFWQFALTATDANRFSIRLARSAGLLRAAMQCCNAPVPSRLRGATQAADTVSTCCRHITGRTKVLVFNYCYHGSVDESFLTLQ